MMKTMIKLKSLLNEMELLHVNLGLCSQLLIMPMIWKVPLGATTKVKQLPFRQLNRAIGTTLQFKLIATHSPGDSKEEWKLGRTR